MAELQQFKKTPTVVPVNHFNPKEDAEHLHHAMKSGTDEKTLINILARRSNRQRNEIAKEYKTLYGRDLIEHLKSKTSGNLKHLLVAMVTPITEFYAEELHRAMKGLGTTEHILIEIMCTMVNSDILRIKSTYENLYKNSLESDIVGDTSGILKRIMVSLCNARRDESMITDISKAISDAQALYEGGELKWGTDDSIFNAVLCQRNYAQLMLIFKEYEVLSGNDIEEAIKSEFSGSSKDALLALVRSIKNQSGFFAKLLYKSMKGLGTADQDLIRLVVTRSEFDMEDIKTEYNLNHGETLAEAIKGDTSGNYKRCLLTLIAEAED